MSCVPLPELTKSPPWQAGFLAVLPAVRTHARIRFRYLRPESREEAVQATIASACLSYQRLARQGKLHGIRPSSLADYAVRRVRSGRTIGGRQNSLDVHSPLARRKHPIRLHSLTPSRPGDEWQAALLESRRVAPADLAAFHLDFAQWLGGFAQRDRRIISALASGEATSAVAGRFGLTAGRVSQLRRRYEQDWRLFQGEAVGSN
jgi:hypothetical protein